MNELFITQLQTRLASRETRRVQLIAEIDALATKLKRRAERILPLRDPLLMEWAEVMTELDDERRAVTDR